MKWKYIKIEIYHILKTEIDILYDMISKKINDKFTSFFNRVFFSKSCFRYMQIKNVGMKTND